jgi:O-antigen/teichoic acid export membrane protein
MYRLLARNVIANWIGLVVHVAVTFFLTPFVLRELGDARYGVWVISVSIVGHYGLLDLGLRASTTQYLTRYLSTKQYAQMNGTMSTMVVILSVIGVVLFAFSVALSLGAAKWFVLPDGMETDLAWCLVIVGGTAAFQCALFPFQAAFSATQRFDLSNLIGVATRLVSAAGTWWCLTRGYGLVGLAAATAGGSVLDVGLRWLVSYRLIPELRLSPRLASWASLREVSSFAVWNFILAVGGIVMTQTDVLLIGLFLPIAATASYALAGNVIQYMGQVAGSAAVVFYPAATQLDARNDVPQLRRLLLSGSRALLLMSLVMSIIGGVWAEDFFRIWVGEDSLGTDGIRTAVVLLRVLAASAVLEALSSAPGQILLGSKRVKALAIPLASQILVKLAVSIVLVMSWGSIGVALGSLVAVAIHRGLVIPVLVCRQLAVPVVSYYRQVCLRPALVAVLLLASALLLRSWQQPEGWLALAGQGAIAAVLAVLLAVLFGGDSNERSQLVRWMARPLIRAAGSIGMVGREARTIQPADRLPNSIE